MMVGYLLARAGIEVTVLEKHADFLRDFRGDTIHPSTLDVIAELGLLDAFLALPHQKVTHAEIDVGSERVRLADLSHLPTRCKFIAFMPQWDFLNFLAAEAKAFPTFRLLMQTEAVDFMRADGRIIGVAARAPSQQLEIRANLVIGADGRDSRLRHAAGLEVTDLGAPMDVLWFKLDYRESEHHAVLGRIAAGQAMVMLDRGDYWQCALIIRKGTAEAVKAEGLDAFRKRVANLAKRESVDEIKSLDDVKLLTVTVDRLNEWCRPGMLMIGDAAHAMSPIGGVGINLAVQDAVAAANILAEPLRNSHVTLDDLHRVQARRMFPTRATQRLQVIAQNRFVDPVLRSTAAPRLPWLMRLMQYFPVLQRIPGRLIGLGFRPEHVAAAILDAPVKDGIGPVQTNGPHEAGR